MHLRSCKSQNETLIRSSCVKTVVFLHLFVVCVTLPGQQEVSSPRLVSTTAEPAPPPSSADVLCSPKRPGSETGSGSTGSVWPSRPGCSADPNTETTSGTTSAAGLPGTRRRTVEKHRGRGGVSGSHFTQLYSSVLTYGKVPWGHVHITPRSIYLL